MALFGNIYIYCTDIYMEYKEPRCFTLRQPGLNVQCLFTRNLQSAGLRHEFCDAATQGWVVRVNVGGVVLTYGKKNKTN